MSAKKNAYINLSMLSTNTLKSAIQDLSEILFIGQDYGNAPYGRSPKINAKIDEYFEALATRDAMEKELRSREVMKRRRSPTTSASSTKKNKMVRTTTTAS